jgi:hypothetical protein
VWEWSGVEGVGVGGVGVECGSGGVEWEWRVGGSGGVEWEWGGGSGVSVGSGRKKGERKLVFIRTHQVKHLWKNFNEEVAK